MKKQGVELSMNVIIIAAIGLLVLVILAVLVINSGGRFQGGTQSCSVKGGVCSATCSNGELSGGTCEGSNRCCKIFTVSP